MAEKDDLESIWKAALGGHTGVGAERVYKQLRQWLSMEVEGRVLEIMGGGLVKEQKGEGAKNTYQLTYTRPPLGPEHVVAQHQVRKAIQKTAEVFNECLPKGREKALAIMALEEALGWAFESILQRRLTITKVESEK